MIKQRMFRANNLAKHACGADDIFYVWTDLVSELLDLYAAMHFQVAGNNLCNKSHIFKRFDFITFMIFHTFSRFRGVIFSEEDLLFMNNIFEKIIGY